MASNDLVINYNTNPTNDNIYYAFQRLITPLSIATKFEPYKESWNEINDILNKIIEWSIEYDKNKDLSIINQADIKSIIDELYDLDGKYLSEDGLYMEEAYEWILQLKNILNNYIDSNN